MDYRQLLLEGGLELLGSGLTVETWGNISVLDRETGLMYITPSGMDYKSCTREDIVAVDPDGRVVQGHRKPSIETGLHLAVYRSRPEVGAVLHTHPIWSTVFSCMEEDIPLIIDEAAQALGGPVRVCSYALPGSKELAEACVAGLGQQANACLLRSHGAVCVGKDLKAAFKVARVLEMTAQILWRVRSLGREPVPIAPEHIAAMMELAKSYGQPKTCSHT